VFLSRAGADRKSWCPHCLLAHSLAQYFVVFATASESGISYLKWGMLKSMQTGKFLFIDRSDNTKNLLEAIFDQNNTGPSYKAE
jgi:hypothetical protein